MKKQDTINTVKNNDGFSSGLMEQYGKWMGGECFQNTDLPDFHLSEAPFDGMDPQSNGAELEKITTKKKGPKKESPKAQLATKEEVVITCEKCGGNHDSADCPNILEREEVEIDGEIMVLEKIRVENWDKMDEGSLQQARKNIGRDPKKASCWKGYKAKGTKMKGGKSVPNCVKVEGKSYSISMKSFGDMIKEDLEEALKGKKLDIKETGVKNKIQINPEVKSEEAKAPVKK